MVVWTGSGIHVWPLKLNCGVMTFAALKTDPFGLLIDVGCVPVLTVAA